MADGATPTASGRKGPRLRKVVRVHHTNGAGYTDFENEKDALDFVNEATTVKTKKEPDGSTSQVFSPNAHLFHGAKHPDYPDARVENVQYVEWPEDEE